MITAEKEAILTYLEFSLTTMVEGLNIKDELLLGNVWDAAYEVLNEMERSLTEMQEHKLIG